MKIWKTLVKSHYKLNYFLIKPIFSLKTLLLQNNYIFGTKYFIKQNIKIISLFLKIKSLLSKKLLFLLTNEIKLIYFEKPFRTSNNVLFLFAEFYVDLKCFVLPPSPLFFLFIFTFQF